MRYLVVRILLLQRALLQYDSVELLLNLKEIIELTACILF